MSSIIWDHPVVYPNLRNVISWSTVQFLHEYSKTNRVETRQLQETRVLIYLTSLHVQSTHYVVPYSKIAWLLALVNLELNTSGL